MLVHTRRRIETDLHRRGVIFFHFLSRKSGRLRGDFENHRRRIGIGLDVQLREGEYAAPEENDDAQDDDRSARQAETEQGLDQMKLPRRRLWSGG